jgi:3-oxoacyl-[acyl-carrier protein] reductase
MVLVARDQPGLDETATAVRSAGAEAMTLGLDLLDLQSAKTVIDATLAQHGRIDALLNIAGAVPQINVFDMTDAQWDSGMGVKFHTARRLTMRAWDALKAARGSVVFMSGSAALDPAPASAAVAAINAAITALAKAFAEQGIADGVQVNSVLPGAVMTERRRAFFEQWAPAHQMTVDAAIAAFPARVGSARLGTPEEIADLMAYLVSPAAKWMTGSAVRMDGGEIKGI